MTSANQSGLTIPSAHASPERPADRRVAGVDLARALAVLGMFVAHVGPAELSSRSGAAAAFLAALSDGHASILFGTLAGVSLALSTGGSRPHDGPALRRDRVRIAVRAAILFLLGMALTQIGVPIMVILSFYAIYFVVALPFLRMRPVVLAVLAAVWAVAGPVVSFVFRGWLGPSDVQGGALSFGDLTSWSGAGSGFLRLLVTGAYPMLTWMPFVLAGLAVGRLDLRSTAVRLRLLATGAGLAVLGSGGSWLALHAFGGERALQPVLSRLAPIAAQLGQDPLSLLQASNYGTVATGTPAFLLINGPHSGTPFEIVGSTGCALAALALCLFVSGRWRTVLAPLAAVGSLALTVYTGQAVALKILEQTVKPAMMAHPWLPLLGFVLITVAFCGLWRVLLGRGPLERLMHWASTKVATAVAGPRHVTTG
jgi:uncharacterized membrane protein